MFSYIVSFPYTLLFAKSCFNANGWGGTSVWQNVLQNLVSMAMDDVEQVKCMTMPTNGVFFVS